MEDLKKLNIEFKHYLGEISSQLTEDLIQLLKGESVTYLNENTKADIKAFYFEYEYDYLNIVSWGVDATGRMASNKIYLPAKKNQTTEENNEWTALIPEKIWTAAAEFQDEYEDDDLDEILEEYDEEKYLLFEQWFFECWKKASAQTMVNIDAYFSIHDSYFRTDLNTLKIINEDEIAQRQY